ncbi:MAG: glycerate kinase [Clostridium sp.]|uniref:glycerate kinase n=1 Tax=Clostridium sp. TaxID=1506 RepID=UPI003F33736E
MKFVLAPDSFKESMTSKEACNAMERGIKKVIKDAECIKVPMADGGEGTVEALVNGTNGRFEKVMVTPPMADDRKISALYGILGDGKRAVIEMAQASGIGLVKRENRNPLLATTYGTGEMILHALDNGAEHIVIGIGGSATNDGGVGMLMALGVKFYDKEDKELGFGGEELLKLERIDIEGLDKRIKNTSIEVACDVTNPLVGEFGASRVFGPQKGATEEMVETLDKALTNYARVIKKDLGIEVKDVEGSGAAGGLGAALLAFLNGKLKRGIDLVIEHSGLKEKVKGADYVFTGEGAIDSQTIFGKTPMGVAKSAKLENAKVIAFAGKVEDGSENLYEVGIDGIFSIMRGVTDLDTALKEGQKNLEKTVENIVRIINI